MKHKGFTVIEFLGVLAAILVLSATVIPVGSQILNYGRYNAAASGAAAISTAISQYTFEMEEYPQNLEVLTKSAGEGQFGPWITEEALIDPWGQDYQFAITDGRVAVWSCGPDQANQTGGSAPEDDFPGDDIGVVVTIINF